MVRAKNYGTVSTFVKVMQRKLLFLFFRTQCISHKSMSQRQCLLVDTGMG